MSLNNFESLQEHHENLLKRQFELSTRSNLSDKDKEVEEFSKEVKEYIAKTKKDAATVFLIQEREQLRSNLRYWANVIYEKENKFPDIDLPETIPTKNDLPANSYRTLAVPAIVSVIGLIILVLVVQKIFNTQWANPVQTPTAPSTPTVLIVKYGFDIDKDTTGWVPQETRPEDQAVTDVNQQVKFGEGSLQLIIEMIGNHAQKSKGEVFVDLSSNPPLGETEIAPLDLNGKPITMLVYVPSTAIGIPSNPNGIQVFVRDSSDRSQYGVWMNLTFHNTNKWTSITLRPSLKTSPEEEKRGASTDEGFDPSRIDIVGLKIGAGSAFDKDFIGSIWIDEVTWP